MKIRIDEARSAQQGEVRAYKDTILKTVMDEQHPLTSESQLDYNQDPQVKQSWVQLQTIDPWAASGIRARLAANAKGMSHSLGTDFYDRGLLPLLEGRVKDVDDLQSYFGGDQAPISASGIKRLEQEAQKMQTPQG